MGDVISLALIIVVAVGTFAAILVYLGSSGARRKRMNAAPAVLLPPGENPDVLLSNARRSYTLLQRAVRVLDPLQGRGDLNPAIIKEIKTIVDAFYAM